MTHTVLIAEDDRAIRDSLGRALMLQGYRVRIAANGTQTLAVLAEQRPDVLVLDVMMPEPDGLEVCRRLREAGDRTPVLMLTARVEVPDRIAGLDAGADDYLVKPFDVEELFARLRALLRRNPPAPAAEVLAVADLRIEPPARRAWRAGEELELSRTEFDLLELLARHAGAVLDQATLYERIWGYDFGPGSKNLAVFIGYLRRKLDRPGLPPLIHTVRGVGYTLRRQ
ncbi:two-component system response regulator MprA [Streptomyces sp. 1114.5]|uniref:response regulator transcription factor n=1 Tax=unclassified Streptomyces TaxID=2593676 RepID=UPI000BD1160D|nr:MULTISPECIES: response regulator transcription factor [unclassified Streptomyces]RKT19748.1 two-component system response regulator MprA [Streptomyces sp. 1114.5]SOB85947.1 two-component system, OmpR family, response regulator MprA [Streptomyces sp. 1331.2]